MTDAETHQIAGARQEPLTEPELVEPYGLEPDELEAYELTEWDEDTELDEVIFAGLLRLAP
jgi:hypothetical protein